MNKRINNIKLEYSFRLFGVDSMLNVEWMDDWREATMYRGRTMLSCTCSIMLSCKCAI